MSNAPGRTLHTGQSQGELTRMALHYTGERSPLILAFPEIMRCEVLLVSQTPASFSFGRFV